MGYVQKQTVKWPEGIWLIFWCFLHTFHWFDPKKLGKHQPKEGNTMIQLASDLISVFLMTAFGAIVGKMQLLVAISIFAGQTSPHIISSFSVATIHENWSTSHRRRAKRLHVPGGDNMRPVFRVSQPNPNSDMYLVGGFKHVYFFHNIWDNRIILPIDELIFFKMVIAPAWLKTAPLSTRRNV